MRYEQLSVGILTVDQIIGGVRHGPIGRGDAWYLDGTNGSNGNSGKTLNTPLKTLPAGESALVASQNDVLYVLPATYTLTTELAWDKDYTHLIGLMGPNQLGDHSLTGCTIYSSTTSVVETIDITADRCVFANLMIGNGGNNAVCVGAVNVDGWGNYFKRVTFLGSIADNQNTAVAAASLLIDRLGHFPIFEDCIIGQTGWGTRTADNSGVLRFVGTTAPAPQNGIFRRCDFLSRSDDSAVAMVALPANTCISHSWLFEDCMFYNFSMNHTASLGYIFYDNCGSTFDIILKNSVHRGADTWANNNRGIFTCQANAASNGGESIAISTS